MKPFIIICLSLSFLVGCDLFEELFGDDEGSDQPASLTTDVSPRYFEPPFQCYTSLGEPVQFIYKPNSGNWYAYRDVYGVPYISWDPYIGPRLGLTEKGDLFFYAHECAHHALGHTTYGAYPLTKEKNADCYGINWLTNNGYMSESDVRQVVEEISVIPGDGWVYLPGPQRAISISACSGYNS